MSRSLNKEIISASCIVLIILLFQAIDGNICNAASKINTNRKIVVIDPGHGGEDTGITVNSNLYEKTCTLELAKLISRLLEDRYTIFLTRESDLNLAVCSRTAFANIKKADIFISLHAKKKADSSSFIIFVPPAGTTLLKPESSLPWEKEQLKHFKKSKAAAKQIATTFSHRFHTDFNTISAPAIVLQGAQMPAVLIEVLSMEYLMGETDYQEILQDYARAIAESLEKILD